MRLVSIRIRGFQSFDDSGEIEFADGTNLIIGQNNAGKSALLRALLPVLADDRHRTPAKWETYKLQSPKVTVTVDKLREVAEHPGVSMADVFAADRVIWVEGQTEKLCFPYLYKKINGSLPWSTIFTSVAATGDFNSKNAIDRLSMKSTSV